jgi:hypothetical protein
MPFTNHKMNPYEPCEVAVSVEGSKEGGQVEDEGWRKHVLITVALFWNIPLALFLVLAIVGKISSRQADWLYFLWASTLPILSTTVALFEPLRKRLILPSISRTKSRNGLLFFAAFWIVILCFWYISLKSESAEASLHEQTVAPKPAIGCFEMDAFIARAG